MRKRSALEAYYEKVSKDLSVFLENRNVCLLEERKGGAMVSRMIAMSRIQDFRTILGKERTHGSIIEVRASSYQLDRPRRPDWLTLEISVNGTLDLSSNSFRNIREVLFRTVQAASRFLRDVQLRYFWKLGSENMLQLMLPIVREYEPAAALDFAKMLAEMIHERMPTLTTIGATPSSGFGSNALVRIDWHSSLPRRLLTAPFSPIASRSPRQNKTMLALPLSEAQLLYVMQHQKKALVPQIGLDATGHLLSASSALFREVYAAPNDLDLSFAPIEMLAQETK